MGLRKMGLGLKTLAYMGPKNLAMGYTIWANAITFRAQNSKPLDIYIAGRPDLRETESPEKWEFTVE